MIYQGYIYCSYVVGTTREEGDTQGVAKGGDHRGEGVKGGLPIPGAVWEVNEYTTNSVADPIHYTRFLVSQAGRVLHLVTQHQFLDSPEWFGVTTDEYFQVTVTALEECSVLVWHRDRIKLTLMEDIHLQAVLDKVIARDVVRKLLQVS